MVTQQIKLYMDDTVIPDIRMVSGDVGREIVLYVYPNKESTESLDLTTFELRVIFIKPDKTFVIQDYIDGIMDIPTQVGAVVGNGYYQIRLSKAGEEIYSAQGNLIIDDYILNDSMVESVAEINGYNFPDDFLTKGDFNPDNYATKQYVDDEISQINPLQIYSTEETLFGTWLGENFYRKVVAIPHEHWSSSTTKDVYTLTNENVIHISYVIVENGKIYVGGEESIRFKCENGFIKLQTQGTSWDPEEGSYFVMEYTKSN